jgi:hypothetical protein
MKVRELLRDETTWLQGRVARDARGAKVVPEDATAVRWCVVGAIARCYGPRQEAIWPRVLAGLGLEARKDPSRIARWNDQTQTTFAAVRRLIDTLDI